MIFARKCCVRMCVCKHTTITNKRARIAPSRVISWVHSCTMNCLFKCLIFNHQLQSGWVCVWRLTEAGGDDWQLVDQQTQLAKVILTADRWCSDSLLWFIQRGSASRTAPRQTELLIHPWLVINYVSEHVSFSRTNREDEYSKDQLRVCLHKHSAI